MQYGRIDGPIYYFTEERLVQTFAAYADEIQTAYNSGASLEAVQHALERMDAYREGVAALLGIGQDELQLIQDGHVVPVAVVIRGNIFSF